MTDARPPRTPRARPAPEAVPLDMSGDDIEKRLAGGLTAGTVVFATSRSVPRSQRSSTPAGIGADAGGGRRTLMLTALAAGLVLGLVVGVRFLFPTTSAAAVASASPTSTLAAVLPAASLPPTPQPTPLPTATPAPLTLTVDVDVTTDNGGNEAASNWTVEPNSDGASPASATGKSRLQGGVTFHLEAGQAYRVSADARSGYTASTSGACSGSLGAGETATCTIHENDQPARLAVYTYVKAAGRTPGDFMIAVNGPGASAAASGDNSHGQVYTLNSHAPYSVSVQNGAGYSVTDSCSGSGIAEGALRICSVTISDPGAGFVVPPLFPLVPLLPRRRRGGLGT